MRSVRGHVRPHKPNQDDFAVNRVLGVKLTPAILEFPDLRRIQNAVLAIGPGQSPLMGLWIVRAQRQTFNVTRRTIDLDRVQLDAPIPNLVADAGAL
jgi:hypothetical protein